MRFRSAMTTLEPQKYVIARTVWTENILLVSGRLVFFFFFKTVSLHLFVNIQTVTEQTQFNVKDKTKTRHSI